MALNARRLCLLLPLISVWLAVSSVSDVLTSMLAMASRATCYFGAGSAGLFIFLLALSVRMSFNLSAAV